MADGIIYIKESDPPTDVTLHPTVPVTCPPSEMTLGVHQSVGLDIADCSVTFTDPLANQTLTIGALQSSNSFSRVARIVFSAISSPGSPWHGYRPDHCPVCSQDCNLHVCCSCVWKQNKQSFIINPTTNIKRHDFHKFPKSKHADISKPKSISQECTETFESHFVS